MEIKQVKKRDIDPHKEYIAETEEAYAVEHKLLKGSDLKLYLIALKNAGIMFEAFEIIAKKK